MITVKKYGNRRLYDTEGSRYITLEELADIIRAGHDVRVVDVKTGKDLTQPTLAQIILESRGAAKLLPVPVLMRLIRMGDDALAEFFGAYTSWALELYLRVKQGAQVMSPYNPFAGLPIPGMGAFGQVLGGAPPWAPPAEPSPPPAQPAPEPTATPSTADEVAELRRELEELKRTVRGDDDRE